MDEMKLLEDFCAAQPEPHPDWLTRARSNLTARTGASRRRRRPWVRGWLTPLAAAAAVVAAIAVPLAVLHEPGPRPKVVTLGGPGGTPPYFVAAPGHGHYAIIGSTATGKTLATIHLPSGGVTYNVSATADDRTFLLQTSPPSSPGFGQTTAYLAHFDPKSRTVSVAKLRLHLHIYPVGYDEQSLSPDGTMMAVSDMSYRPTLLTITIFNLTTGSSRTWTRATPIEPLSQNIAWSADSRQVEIAWQARKPLEQYTERLNVAAPAGHLPAPDRQALPASFGGTDFYQYIAPNGDVFYGVYHSSSKTWMLAEYSPGTHRFSYLLGPAHRTDIDPGAVWASDNGQVLIIRGSANGLGYFSHGRYTPLPQTALIRKLVAVLPNQPALVRRYSTIIAW